MKKVMSILLIISFTVLLIAPYKVNAEIITNPVYTFSDGSTMVIDDSIKTLLASPLIQAGMQYSSETKVLAMGLEVYNRASSVIDMPKADKDIYFQNVRDRARIKFQPWVYDLYNSIAGIFKTEKVINYYNSDGIKLYNDVCGNVIVFAQGNTYVERWLDGGYFYVKGEFVYAAGSGTSNYVVYDIKYDTYSKVYSAPISAGYVGYVKDLLYTSHAIDGVNLEPKLQTLDYTSDVLNLNDNYDYVKAYPASSELGLKYNVSAINLVGINTLDGVADDTLSVPVDDTETAKDTNKTVTSIWDWLKAFPNTLLGILEKIFGKSTDISGQNVSDIQGNLQSKFDCPRLKQSFDKLKMMNTSRGNPPKFYINLGKLSNASSKRFGFTGAFEDKETVFFDFATLNEYKFMGLPLPDWTYNIIGFGMLYLTAIYVWNKLHPREGLA